jgi:hypothetical protein
VAFQPQADNQNTEWLRIAQRVRTADRTEKWTEKLTDRKMTDVPAGREKWTQPEYVFFCPFIFLSRAFLAPLVLPR